MKNKNRKSRSDQPSGRQASELPEHKNHVAPDHSSLHQGQGPDFQTQDEVLRRENPGITQIEKAHQKPFNDSIDHSEQDKPEGRPVED